MKNVKITILALSMVFFTSAAIAGGAIGITISGTSIDASGFEKVKTSGNKTTHSASDDAVIPSIFVEQTNEDIGLTIGLDLIPYAAEVGSGSNTGDDDAETSGTNSVNVNFKNHITLYAEKTLPFVDGLYIKAGVSRVTLQTDDTISTGAEYGDSVIGGVTFGLGVKRDLNILGADSFFKAEIAMADYEAQTFASTNTGNTVELEELDTEMIRLSIGKKF